MNEMKAKNESLQANMRSILSEVEALNDQLRLLKAERSRMMVLDSQLKDIYFFLAQFEGTITFSDAYKYAVIIICNFVSF